jgi:predicted nucleic acid-binding protein
VILLDTNVVSEPLRAAPDARVVEWIDAQPLETLFLSAITVAELRAGVALLPAGKRRTGLQHSLETQVLPLFAGRVLPFDLACTQAYAALLSAARGACRGPGHREPRWLHRRHRDRQRSGGRDPGYGAVQGGGCGGDQSLTTLSAVPSCA